MGLWFYGTILATVAFGFDNVALGVIGTVGAVIGWCSHWSKKSLNKRRGIG